MESSYVVQACSYFIILMCINDRRITILFVGSSMLFGTGIISVSDCYCTILSMATEYNSTIRSLFPLSFLSLPLFDSFYGETRAFPCLDFDAGSLVPSRGLRRVFSSLCPLRAV